jgi:CheY-like chemotaxis protein
VRAVVCDDDAVTRSVITSLVEERDARVIAEADRSFDAMHLIDRFAPELIVLDMSLAMGSGLEVLEHVRQRDLPCQVVVFTAFGPSTRDVQARGVHVVEKPDFEGLQRALDAALHELDAPTATGTERRRSTRQLAPAASRSPSGLDDPAAFYRALGDAEPGDALVSLSVEGADEHGLPSAVRAAVRAQDLVTVRHGALVVLLVAGGADGVAAVLRRLAAVDAERTAGARTTVLVEGTDPAAALDTVTAP